jgi:hypothetical protein
MNLHLKQFLAAFMLIAVFSAGIKAFVPNKSKAAGIQTESVSENCRLQIEHALKSVTTPYPVSLQPDFK